VLEYTHFIHTKQTQRACNIQMDEILISCTRCKYDLLLSLATKWHFC